VVLPNTVETARADPNVGLIMRMFVMLVTVGDLYEDRVTPCLELLSEYLQRVLGMDNDKVAQAGL
jgi:hypothetical protein